MTEDDDELGLARALLKSRSHLLEMNSLMKRYIALPPALVAKLDKTLNLGGKVQGSKPSGSIGVLSVMSGWWVLR